MDSLRWTILGIGVVVLAAVYAYGRWQERRERARAEERVSTGRRSDPGAPREPIIDESVADGADAGSGTESGTERRAAAWDTPFGDDEALEAIDRLIARSESLQAEEGDPAGSDPGAERRRPAREPDDGGLDGERPWWEMPARESPASAEEDAHGTAGRSRNPAGPPEPLPLDFGEEWPDGTAGSGPAGSEPRAAPDAPEETGSAPDRRAGESERAPADRAAMAGGDDAEEPAARDDRGSGARAPAGDRGGQAGEPPPLELPPASRVEIDAFTNGHLEDTGKIIVLSVRAPEGERFHGADVRAALQGVRMVPGEHRIWHRRGRSEVGRFNVFSVASLVEPGYLDPDEMDGIETPGLSFFMQLPLPVDGEEALDALFAASYRVARALGGELLDAHRSTLSRQAAERLREELREHRRQLNLAAHRSP